MEKITKSMLLNVERPIRYIGSEYNECIKKDNVKVRVCNACSNLYEEGMKNKLQNEIYVSLNSRADVWCERAFLPASDMLNLMTQNDVGLQAIESKDFLNQFDILNFCINDVLEYPNVIKMLDMSGIDRYSKDRIKQMDKPIIFAVGDAVNLNPVPMSEFIDIFIIGQAEDVICNIVEKYKEFKMLNLTKIDFFRSLKNMQGIYIPSIHNLNTLIYSASSNKENDLSSKYLVPNMYECFYEDDDSNVIVNFSEEIVNENKLQSVIKLFNDTMNLASDKITINCTVKMPGSKLESLKKITDVVNTIITIYEKIYSKSNPKKIKIVFETFIVYPHTNLQWYKKNSIRDIIKFRKFLTDNITEKSQDIEISFVDAKIEALRQILMFSDETIFTYLEKLVSGGFVFYSDTCFIGIEDILTEDLSLYDEFLIERDVNYKFSFDNFVFPSKEKIKLKKEYKNFLSKLSEENETL